MFTIDNIFIGTDKAEGPLLHRLTINTPTAKQS